MTRELIGAAIMIGIIGICSLIGVFFRAVGDCAKDSAEFPDQGDETWPAMQDQHEAKQ